MRGVIYARYSSHNQREESIEQQIEECTLLAKKEGISVVGVYADKAVSGKTDKRREFQKMLHDADKKKFDVVIAYKSNRIARNMLNALQYEERLDKLGIKTLYCKEEFGDSAAGRFAFRMMLNMNQFYSENLSEDIKRGMLDNATQCKVNGSIPLGYKKGEDGRYAVDPVGAGIVRYIYQEFLAGTPFSVMAAELNAQGHRTSQGNLFNKGSFHRILHNKVYTGVYRYGDIEIEGGVPCIIPPATFQEAQKRLLLQRTHHKGKDFLLTGKLFCGHCNSPMTGTSGNYSKRTYYYYACRNHKVHKCEKRNEPKDIERRVAEAVRDYVLTDEVMEQIADLCMEYQAVTDIEAEKASLRATRDEAKRGLKNLVDMLEKGIYSDTTQARLLELEDTVKTCERQLAALDTQRIYDRKHILFALSKFKAMSSDNERYQELLIKNFIKAVYLYDDGGTKVECWYGDDIELPSPTVDKGPPKVIRSNFCAAARWFAVQM